MVNGSYTVPLDQSKSQYFKGTFWRVTRGHRSFHYDQVGLLSIEYSISRIVKFESILNNCVTRRKVKPG